MDDNCPRQNHRQPRTLPYWRTGWPDDDIHIYKLIISQQPDDIHMS